MTLTLAENFRAIFYTPFYLLKTLGLAEQAGLELKWLPPGSPGGAIDAIKNGSVDLTWGGPMRVMKDHDTTASNGQSLLCFGEVVTRDPFFLIGKKSLGDFELAHHWYSKRGTCRTKWLYHSFQYGQYERDKRSYPKETDF